MEWINVAFLRLYFIFIVFFTSIFNIHYVDVHYGCTATLLLKADLLPRYSNVPNLLSICR